MIDRDATISFANCGIYNEVVADLLRSFGWRVVMPPRITDATVRRGVRYSPEMICFPYKATLGNILELADMGVKNILTYNSQGYCRFTHFPNLYRDALEALGVDVVLHIVDRNNLYGSLRDLSRTPVGPLGIVRRIWRAWWHQVAVEEREETNFAGQALRVMVVGEAYSLVVPEMNFAVRQRLLNMGISTEVPAMMSHYFRKKFKVLRELDIDRRARALLNGPIAGCAFESLKHTILAGMGGYAGVMHIYPLTCMPETTIKPLIERVARDAGLPMLSVEVDENLSQLNFSTRLETFAEIVRQSAARRPG